MPEKPEIPVRIITVPQPPPKKEKAAVNPIPADLPRLCDRLRYFFARSWRQNLIRVQNQDPFVPKRESLDRPILLFWPGPVELKLHHLRSVSLRYGRGI